MKYSTLQKRWAVNGIKGFYQSNPEKTLLSAMNLRQSAGVCNVIKDYFEANASQC